LPFNSFVTLTEMKLASRNWCDKTTDDEMTSHRVCCFRNWTSHGEQPYFRRFYVGELPPLLDPPLHSCNRRDARVESHTHAKRTKKLQEKSKIYLH